MASVSGDPRSTQGDERMAHGFQKSRTSVQSTKKVVEVEEPKKEEPQAEVPAANSYVEELRRKKSTVNRQHFQDAEDFKHRAAMQMQGGDQ